VGTLEAIRARLETVPDASIERSSVLPEKVADGDLIILRDGDPGEPEQPLGGFGSADYQHTVGIEICVEEGDATARDAAFDNLLQQIGAALEADPTLGDLAFGPTYGRPEPAIEAIAGAPAIKSATLRSSQGQSGRLFGIRPRTAWSNWLRSPTFRSKQGLLPVTHIRGLSQAVPVSCRPLARGGLASQSAAGDATQGKRP
jgi:hypothetical protein